MVVAKGKVLVAMSGGVDSSVAALLLRDQGYEVIGITFQLYDYSRQNRKEGKGGCCSVEDVLDAKAVCHRLGIPHYLVDSKERFQKRVVDYFADAYKKGQTPNPCVACNTFIKFDELDDYARDVGADYYATGHYAQIRRQETGKIQLLQAVDESKDQSYFLVGVADSKLTRLLLPVGAYSKKEIREFAERAQLPVSKKPDSMEVCFVPENDYRRFLKKEYGLEDQVGEIVDEKGRKMGEHRGLHHFTVGQRKGLPSLGLNSHYVIRLEPETNQIVVGEDRSLFAQGFSFHPFDAKVFRGRPLKGEVKIRSRAPRVPVEIVHVGDREVVARFDVPQRAVTPGQYAVFYEGNAVIGGGPIVKPVADFEDAHRAAPKESGFSVSESQFASARPDA